MLYGKCYIGFSWGGGRGLTFIMGRSLRRLLREISLCRSSEEGRRHGEMCLQLEWGWGRRERQERENKGHEEMPCSVEYYELHRVTPLYDPMNIQKIWQKAWGDWISCENQISWKTGQILPQNFCEKVETVSSGAGDCVRGHKFPEILGTSPPHGN